MTTQLSTLANGLRVATDRADTVDTVSLGIWVDVGTRHETADINGVAHFLEHMAFKGTERRSALAIAEEIEAVGGHLNAYTSRESTAYYAKVLKDDVPLALEVHGFQAHTPFGDTRVGFSATADINRSDFGVDFNIPMDDGGVVVGDRVRINLEIEAIRTE